MHLVHPCTHHTPVGVLQVLMRCFHDVAIFAWSVGVVFANGMGSDLNMDHHKLFPYGTLFTNINIGRSKPGSLFWLYNYAQRVYYGGGGVLLSHHSIYELCQCLSTVVWNPGCWLQQEGPSHLTDRMRAFNPSAVTSLPHVHNVQALVPSSQAA